MTGTPRILGNRLGGALSHENGDRAPFAATFITHWVCPSGHEFTVPFSVTAERPTFWDCITCGEPATDPVTPPTKDEVAERLGGNGRPLKSHMDQLKARRTPAELQVLLDEALTQLRERRARGEAPTRTLTEYAS